MVHVKNIVTNATYVVLPVLSPRGRTLALRVCGIMVGLLKELHAEDALDRADHVDPVGADFVDRINCCYCSA